MRAILSYNRDVYAMLGSHAIENRIHAFILSTIVLWLMAVVFVSPTDRHVFRRDRIEAQMTTVCTAFQIQQPSVVLDPRTICADGMIARPSASCESDRYPQQN
jgi:hypothetical protein